MSHAGSHDSETYEVLIDTGKFHWRRSANGRTEPGAVIGGHETDSSILYIARTYVDDIPVVGRLHTRNMHAYFSGKCDEFSLTHDYDILVHVEEWEDEGAEDTRLVARP